MSETADARAFQKSNEQQRTLLHIIVSFTHLSSRLYRLLVELEGVHLLLGFLRRAQAHRGLLLGFLMELFQRRLGQFLGVQTKGQTHDVD